MSYFGIPGGRNKASATIRVTIDNNSNAANNATLYSDSGVGTTVTFATGSSPLELVASLAIACNFVEIFDSTGNTARFMTGAAASEVDLLLDYPGGNGHIPVFIAAGTRVSMKPITAPAAGAEFTVNFYD